MKTRTEKVIFIVLIILLMISVFIAGTMLTLQLLKKTEVDIAKEQGDRMRRNYASSNVTGNSNASANSLEYEIKDEETWDVSKNADGSVIAKWTLNDKTLTISGTGEIKDWNYNDSSDWHDTQYTNIIKKIIIKEGITRIGDYAFYDDAFYDDRYDNTYSECSGLVDVEIPSSVTSIGNSAFYGCSSLASINIPSSVIDIGFDAFFGCSSLVNIEIPSSVTKIDFNVFYGCDSLESINVEVNNKNYLSENGILFSKDKRIIIRFPSNKKDIVEYIIPSSVTSIEEGAFEGCSVLERIEIPNSVTKIDSDVFHGCSSLERIEIPSDVTSIGYYAFYGCSRLTSIKISETVTKIESNAIPSNTIIYTKADSEGHRYAEERKQGYILDGNAIKIETNYEIKDEEIWDISKNVDGSIMAKWTLADKTLTISGVGEIKDWGMYDSRDWHNSQYTKIIKKVIIEGKITKIGYFAFEGCRSLAGINIPSSVTSIGDYAFYKCSNLVNIEIPSNVTSIGDYAFYKCSNIVNIEIPSSVARIGISTFKYCNSLESIKTEENNKNYSSENGILFSKDKKTIIRFPSNKKDIVEYIIPSNVTKIGDFAFLGCSNLKRIEISNSVTSIEYGAFSECSGLEKIEIPSSVTSIEDGTFYRCSSLTNIEIPSSITTIKREAFYGCFKLISIKIPDTITEIGEKSIPANTVIYTKANSEGHRYAEKGKQGYVIWRFEFTEYIIKDNYIVKIKPNTTYNEFIKDIKTNQTYEIKEGSKTLEGINIIKTGQVVTTEAGDEYTLVVIGDLNGDGKISLVEIARISKIGARKVNDIKEIEKMATDTNADGNITILDLASISKLYNQK